MEISLTRKWDAQIAAPFHNTDAVLDESFIGRTKEIELLKNDILQKEEGSILIAGHRGVGKTSFVYKVLQLVKADNKDKSLFIYINAGQLDNNGTGEAGNITTETILKTLIRRLYATAKDFFNDSRGPGVISDKEAKKLKLEKLYKKAVATEFKLNESILNSNTVSNVKEKTAERKVEVEGLKLTTIAPAISFLAGIVLLLFTPATANTVYKVISFALTLPLAVSYSKVFKQSTKDEDQQQVKAEEIYGLDNNLGNLEYDLEEFHRELQKDQIKIIYIIDELDKLSPDQSQKVLRYLKNLFTLSKAIFIFIGNEDIYTKANEEVATSNDIQNYRPESYTFFTSKYFISRPTIDELKEYFFSRINEKVDRNKDYIQRAAHFLAYESKGDYFNMVNTLKDSIVKYENEMPVMDLAVNSPVFIKKSRLHKAMSVVFYQMYYATNFSRRRENELIHRQLMDYIYKLKELTPNSPVTDPKETDRHSSAVRDINRLLATTNFLSKVSDQTLTINGVATILNDYVYNGQFVTEPPEKLDVLSENEKRLVTLADEYLQLLLPVVNVQRHINGSTPINKQQLCDELQEIIKDGVPGVDPTSSNNWFEIYFALQLQQPLQDSNAERIEMGNAVLTDDILRIKTGAEHIFRELLIQWLKKNNYQQPPDPQSFALIGNFIRVLSANKVEWSDFIYLMPDVNDIHGYSVLLGKLSPSLINAMEVFEKDNSYYNKSQLLKNTIIFLFETASPDLPELKQSIQKFAPVNFINVSSTENLMEEFQKTIDIISKANTVTEDTEEENNEEADNYESATELPAANFKRRRSVPK